MCACSATAASHGAANLIDLFDASGLEVCRASQERGFLRYPDALAIDGQLLPLRQHSSTEHPSNCVHQHDKNGIQELDAGEDAASAAGVWPRRLTGQSDTAAVPRHRHFDGE